MEKVLTAERKVGDFEAEVVELKVVVVGLNKVLGIKGVMEDVEVDRKVEEEDL